MRTRPFWAVGMVTVVALVASACGSSSKQSSSSPTTTASASNEVAAKGAAAAAAAGPSVQLPDRTIGYLRFASASDADVRLFGSVQSAAKVIGWKLLSCDAAGDSSKFDSCGQSLLDQGANILITDNIPASGLSATIARAKAHNIPFVTHGGSLEPEERAKYSASYFPDDAALGKTLADYMAKTLGSNDEVSIWGFPQYFAQLREDQFKKVVQDKPLKLVDQGQSDPANIVEGAQAAYQSKLIQFPDLKGIWVSYDVASYGVATAVSQKYAGEQYPNRPLIGTFFANKPTIDLIRQGRVDATAEEALEWTGWVVLDQILEFVTRKTPFATDPRPVYQGLQFSHPVLITKDNLPPKGELVPAPVDFVSFFTAKWKAEFGK
jgi:ABC-type sugar transport system substrate-binding protein